MAKNQTLDTQVLVIGSGAGGSVTALTLAQSGCNVLLLEEGQRCDLESYEMNGVQAISLLYRNRGMTPILGSVPIGYVEGRCLGGSTEINNGFWQRLPVETSEQWQTKYELLDIKPDDLNEHFSWAEQLLHISYITDSLPPSSKILDTGAKKLGWKAEEIPRTTQDYQNSNTGATAASKEAKQGVSRNLIPMAQELGVQVLTSSRVVSLILEKDRVTGVIAEKKNEDGSRDLLNIKAENVFVCCGTMQTPALLRRSGIKLHIGDSLYIHPMLKVAAVFADEMRAIDSVLPVLQIKEFCPDILLGGAFFSLGHLALVVSDNWGKTSSIMKEHKYMATYYVSVRGTGKGTVHNRSFGSMDATPHYELSKMDLMNLSRGFSHLCTILFAAGAKKIYPSISGLDCINSELESQCWLESPLPKSQLSLTTVHAFSSVPIGERQDICAADSFGKITGFQNLYVNDASMLPTSPGTNPQGTIMAIARRNTLHFLAAEK